MGKGGRERWIYLCSPQVLDVLARYRSARQARCPDAAWFFVNRDGKRLSEQSVRRIIARCAGPPRWAGAIHHTCSGIPLPLICGITAAIFTRSKTFWATAPSKPPSAMCTPAFSAKNGAHYRPSPPVSHRAHLPSPVLPFYSPQPPVFDTGGREE